MTEDDEDENRLSRWSRRKIAVANEQVLEKNSVEQLDPEASAISEAELQAELQSNRETAEAVDLETLNEESDFSVFMKAGVPESLKRRAMATLWRSNPVFANVDGLVDYDDDFAHPDLIMKTFKSAYEIGRGYFDQSDENEDEVIAEDDQQPEAGEVDDTIADSKQQDEEPQTDELQEPTSLAGEGAEELPESVVLNEYPEPEEDSELIEPAQPKISLRRRLELEQSS